MRFALGALVVVLFSCGGARTAPGGSEPNDWNVAARIPADTPYAFVVLERPSEEVLAKMGTIMAANVDSSLATFEQLATTEPGPGIRALLALLREMKGKSPYAWLSSIGFAPSARFALYGLSFWPVLRAEVGNEEEVTRFARRMLGGLGMDTQGVRAGSWTLWQAPVNHEYTVIVGVSARDSFASLMPASSIAKALPLLTGARLPERSLEDERTLQALRSQHGYSSFFSGMINLDAAAKLLAGGGSELSRALTVGASSWLPKDCASELTRLSALVPRLAMGYQRFDLQGIAASVVAEMPKDVMAALARVAATAPGVTWPDTSDALFDVGTAVDVGGALSLFGELGAAIRTRPFRCPALEGLNDVGRSLTSTAAMPLPPLASSLRGVRVVVESAQLDPPSGVGHVLAVGEHMTTLPFWLRQVPGMGELKLLTDGSATALPLSELGIPWGGDAHAALAGERFAVAVGGGSAQRATTLLATPEPQRSPLLVFGYDIERFQAFMPSPALANSAMPFKRVAMAMQLVDQGLELAMAASWR
ncbi:MAG: hypothetical protein R3B48_14725 [Kofleriaceae bacterium]